MEPIPGRIEIPEGVEPFAHLVKDAKGNRVDDPSWHYEYSEGKRWLVVDYPASDDDTPNE